MASRVGLRARLRLVGGSVGIDDQVKPRANNRKVAEEYAGTQHTQNVHLHAERVYLGVWRFARCLKAMNDDPAHFCFETEKIPMERRESRLDRRWRIRSVRRVACEPMFSKFAELAQKKRPTMETSRTIVMPVPSRGYVADIYAVKGVALQAPHAAPGGRESSLAPDR